MTRAAAWRWARLTGGAAILAVLVWRVGAGAFLDGLRRVDAGAVVAAVVLNAAATVCCAWRWRLVAGALGARLSLPDAVAACYRAQFLNTTLPGGVLGDVHRGLRHGREVADLGRGLRAVAWERGAGQAVQIVLALLVLAALPSPVRSAVPFVLLAAAASVVVAVVARAVAGRRPRRWLGTVRADAGLVLGPRVWPGVLVASASVVVLHVATFVIAAQTAGAEASVLRLVPLALVALLAMAVPANLGGWGPREGVAAWAFAAAGMGAAQGLAAATVYGVLVFAAGLPGAAVLLAPRRGRCAPTRDVAAPAHREPVTAGGRRG